MKSLMLSALAALAIAGGLLAPAPARAQVDQAAVAACHATRPSPAGYTVTHTGYVDETFSARNPFPGRQSGDIKIEIWIELSPTFACAPAAGGAAFTVTLGDNRGAAPLGDILACQNGVMVFVYVGYPCPFASASRFPAATDFGQPGAYATVTEAGGSTCTIFRPATLGAGGLRHPVILWGNGTGASPASYASLLSHFASHGFVVGAANTPNAGDGSEMLDCLAYLEGEYRTAGSPYANTLNLNRVGTSGHSQGGTGSLFAGRDTRISATAPMEPGAAFHTLSAPFQSGPMFLMSGGADTITPRSTQQQPIYNAANVPVFWGTAIGGQHVPLPSVFKGATTAWFRYHLMVDPAAESQFYGSGCALCLSPLWQVEKKGLP